MTAPKHLLTCPTIFFQSFKLRRRQWPQSLRLPQKFLPPLFLHQHRSAENPDKKTPSLTVTSSQYSRYQRTLRQRPFQVQLAKTTTRYLVSMNQIHHLNLCLSSRQYYTENWRERVEMLKDLPAVMRKIMKPICLPFF